VEKGQEAKVVKLLNKINEEEGNLENINRCGGWNLCKEGDKI
jgi:hypothetical protein